MRFLYIPLIMMVMILPSCLSTARLTDLPKTSGEINFDSYAKTKTERSHGIWSFRTSTEYYLETSLTIPQETLLKIIREALYMRNYKVNSVNSTTNCVTATHAMTFNEWSYVTGVYYKYSPEKIQIYIRTKITQDITGGAKNNLSEKLGMIIEEYIRRSASEKA